MILKLVFSLMFSGLVPFGLVLYVVGIMLMLTIPRAGIAG